VLSVALLFNTLPGGQETLELLGRPAGDQLVLVLLSALMLYFALPRRRTPTGHTTPGQTQTSGTRGGLSSLTRQPAETRYAPSATWLISCVAGISSPCRALPPPLRARTQRPRSIRWVVGTREPVDRLSY